MQQNTESSNNQASALEDLATQNAEEIKGGPKRIFIGGLSVKEQMPELNDLEPREEVKGGREHILLARQVGVPY